MQGMKIHKFAVLLVLAAGIAIAGPACAAAPWDFNGNESAVLSSATQPSGVQDAAWLKGLQWFFSAVSRVDGTRCPMAPTCSAYSIQSFRDYGLLRGFVMTSDRLMRCGGNTTSWVPVLQGGYHDPPDHNIFMSRDSACCNCKDSH